jgi:Na+/citrate or Na+/malate symporter
MLSFETPYRILTNLFIIVHEEFCFPNGSFCVEYPKNYLFIHVSSKFKIQTATFYVKRSNIFKNNLKAISKKMKNSNFLQLFICIMIASIFPPVLNTLKNIDYFY